MGWFDNIGRSIKQGFNSLTNKLEYGINKYVVKPAQAAGHAIAAGASKVYDTGKSVVVTLHEDIKSVVGGAKDIINNGQKTIKDIFNKGADTIGGLGSSLAMPLAIGGVAVVVVMMAMGKK